MTATPAPAKSFLDRTLDVLNPFSRGPKATSLKGKFLRQLNPTSRGSLTQIMGISALIDQLPVSDDIKSGLQQGLVGAETVLEAPGGVVGKTIAGALALEGLGATSTAAQELPEGADLTPAQQQLAAQLKQDRRAGTVQGQGGSQATLSSTPPDPGDVQITPAPTTTSSGSSNGQSSSSRSASTPSQPVPPADRQADTPVRANDETPPVTQIEQTKDDLYESARARAVQTGKQEDLDLVRDLGLAMHAQHFGKKSDLNLSDQTVRAKSFLETQIA